MTGVQHVHADEARQPFVHRIDGDGGGLQSIDLFDRSDVRIFREAAQGRAVGVFLVFQNAAGLGDKWFDRLGGFLRCVIRAVCASAASRRGLRVGVVDVFAQTIAAEDDDEAMFLHRFDEDFHAGNADRLEFLADFDAAFVARHGRLGDR